MPTPTTRSSKPMEALPQPYGYPGGNGISIRVIPEKTLGSAEEIKDCLSGFGCPDFLLNKVISCLQSSGRYDCRVIIPKKACVILQEVFLPLGLKVLTEWEVSDKQYLDRLKTSYLKLRDGSDAGEKARNLYNQRSENPKPIKHRAY